MTDAHRPFLTRSTRRLGALIAGLAVLAVAAVVGLIVQLSDSGHSSPAAGAPHGSGASAPAVVPAGDASSAATTSSAASSTSPTSVPATSSAPVATSSPVAKSTPRTSTPPSVERSAAPKQATYVVKPGDNLTVIAAWFHLHGYGNLYDRNRAAIGNDPNLIHPGLRITLSATGVSMKG